MKLPKHFTSKKFTAFAVGVIVTLILSIAGLSIITKVPEAASAVVNLLTIALASINSVIGVYALGQSAVDWKINSQHNTTQDNKIVNHKKQLVLEAKNHEMKYEGMNDIDWDKVDFDDNNDKLKGDKFNFHFNEK